MRKNAPLLAMLCLLVAILSGCDQPESKSASTDTFRILMSEDIRALEPVVAAYFSGDDAAPYEIAYEGIADIRRILQQETSGYDAVWLSNSIPLHLLDGGQRIADSSFTAISPVVFAVRTSTAEALGLAKDVSMRAIVEAIKTGDLSFAMPSVTQTNSGLSAYLGILSALLSNPDVLTLEDLSAPGLQEELTAFFAKVTRSSGSDAFISTLVLEHGYDCIVASEADVIRLNRQLEAAGQEPMRLLYPEDGVTIGDAPLAYIDQGNAEKREQFLALQQFVLGQQGQAMLAALGMRTDLGGLIAPEHRDIFPEAWGIDPDAYIQTIVYPAKGVILEALAMYQELLRKPSHTAFCLDFSGSMHGKGREELLAGMAFLLDADQAGQEFIQFTEKDRVTVLAFGSDVLWSETASGAEGMRLYDRLASENARGNTNLHEALLACLDALSGTDTAAYSVSIVVMTDGQATSSLSAQEALRERYAGGGTEVPIYSILYGDADAEQLIPLAEMSGGAVFDGKDDLAKAFRTVRGFN